MTHNRLSDIRNEKERHFAAVYFNHNEWRSQPTYFPLSDGSRYTPDFYDEKADEFIEVVGSRQAFHQGKAKYRLFRKCYPQLTLKIFDYRGYPYLKTPEERENKAMLIDPQKLQIIISGKQRERVREHAHKKGVSIAEIMRRLIDKEYFPGLEGKPAKTDDK